VKPALSGLTGTAAGHRATTNSYIAILQRCDTIASRARRYVYPGDFIDPSSAGEGRRYADVRKHGYARKPK